MVKVKLFANFREVAGVKEVEVDASSIKELLSLLMERYPKLKEHFKEEKIGDYVHIMVNGRIVEDLNATLSKNDTVAIFPPVSGGWQNNK